jgi:hypothetical protein
MQPAKLPGYVAPVYAGVSGVSAEQEILKFLPPVLKVCPFFEGQRAGGPEGGAGAEPWGVEARVHLLKKSIMVGVASM